MNTCSELSYNKNYFNTIPCCIISDVADTYDAEKFAEWLTNVFVRSSYKSWEEVAKDVKPVRGATRSTLSRYAGAKKQMLTDKPSQPKPELVIKLAEIFRDDVNKVLAIAGHAAQNGKPQVPQPIMESFQRSGADVLSETDVNLVVNFIDMLKKQRQENKE